MIHCDSILLIIGDFNIDIHANSQRRRHVIECMHWQQLNKITNKSTPKTKSHIDHIWTNLPFWILWSQYIRGILEWPWSHSCFVTFVLDFLFKMLVYVPNKENTGTFSILRHFFYFAFNVVPKMMDNSIDLVFCYLFHVISIYFM